ncbi:hypothetical protein [Novosphingobium sp. PhB165]|uniref:hypothetical protein n=1 Tax=Novosphingobium sp. PhB165 TaxID=2485105 RepID=UPI001FB394EB|nr:hypothetical protein [Novosphingobium sp. PhB165]
MDQLGQEIVARAFQPFAQIAIEQVLQRGKRIWADLRLRIPLDLAWRCADSFQQHRAVGFGNAHEIRNRESRSRMGVADDDIALPFARKSVDQTICQRSQVLFVLPDAPIGQQTCDQRAMLCMPGSVEADQVRRPWQAIADFIELRTNVIAVRFEGQRRNGPKNGKAGRNALILAIEQFGQFIIAGYHIGTLIWLALYRADCTNPAEIIGGIIDHGPIVEEIR